MPIKKNKSNSNKSSFQMSKIPPVLKTTLKVIIFSILFIISLPFIIWAGFWLYDLIFNYDLRSKKSYSRDLSITFEYKGDEYTINPTFSCINEGRAFSIGTGRWYNKWQYNIKNTTIVAKDGKKLEFAFGSTPKYHRKFDSYIPIKNKGRCQETLSSEDDKLFKIIDSLMRFDNETDYWEVYRFGRMMIEDIIDISNNREQKYINSRNNYMYIRDLSQREKRKLNRIRTPYKIADVKIKYFSVGEKRLIDN